MTKLFVVAFLACAIANFAFSILILRILRSAGIKVGPYEIRWQVHKHFKSYKTIRNMNQEKIDLPYYGYWISLFGMALFLGLVLLNLRPG